MIAAATRIDVLRHGETTDSGRYCGSRNVALTPRGWEQMRAALGSDCPWERVVSSPLARCAAFARALAQQHGLPIAIETRLREYDFGAWEGKSAAELLAADPAGIACFWDDPVRHPPPAGEDVLRFQERVLEAWGELLTRHAGEHLLVITHGGPIRVILGRTRGIPLPEQLRLDVPLAGLIRVRTRAAASRCDRGSDVLVTGP